ncbi:MucR family transcriptional regulator [Methylobacterium sp. AMS5]|uniref:MucR family transcriptional regulator n=1 Tax=Methylobacterium sp. AMS5 TaxID=925818 RepID=UPI00074F9DDA|nr:MucR family transcriptional regulator [Methylobacterium sp. AMS5]AMB43390.1 MucR family transcriptional regulator [Methylobacterium sp. AMS5]
MTHIDARRSANALDLAGDIVSAYVANNSLTMSELPKLIAGVHAALSDLANGATTDTSVEAHKATPAQIRRSVTPDALISFLDGKAYKTLKRHLAGHGLNPRSYRERYGLPADYPMVAPSYAEQRSQIAKAIGLGQPINAEAIRAAAGASHPQPDRANRRGRRRSADR